MTKVGPILLLATIFFTSISYSQCRHKSLNTCGSGREMISTGIKGSRCKRCHRGFFSDSRTPSCTPCKTCMYGVKRKCTRKRNTICHARKRSKSLCAVLFMYGRFKTFKRHCQKFYTKVRSNCQSKSMCWWRDMIPEEVWNQTSDSARTIFTKPDNSNSTFTTKEKYAIHGSRTTTDTNYFKPAIPINNEPRFTGTDMITESRTERSPKVSLEMVTSGYTSEKTTYITENTVTSVPTTVDPSLFLPNDSDDRSLLTEHVANYEEIIQSTQMKGNLSSEYIVVITSVSSLIIIFLVTLLAAAIPKIKRKILKTTPKNGDSSMRSVPKPSKSCSSGDVEIGVTNTTQQNVPVLVEQGQIREHIEQSAIVERERHVSCHTVNTLQRVEVSGRKHRICPRPKSTESNEAQVLVYNTLPVTEKEKATVFGLFSTETNEEWPNNSYTGECKMSARVKTKTHSLPSFLFKAFLSDADDTVPLCNGSASSLQEEDMPSANFVCSLLSSQTVHNDSNMGTDSGCLSPAAIQTNLSETEGVAFVSDHNSATEEYNLTVLRQGEQTRSDINNLTESDLNNPGSKDILTDNNNLQLQKPKHYPPENIFDNLYKSAGTQTRHNSDNTRSIYGHQWNTSCHFTSEGGKMTRPNSDIALDVPTNAVPEGETVFVQGLFSVDFNDIQRQLRDDEVIVSPIAEFQMTFMERWAKFVKVVLPYVTRNPSETFSVHYYQRNKKGDVEYGDVPYHDLCVNQEMYYIRKANHVEIYTIHFTGFYCSVCGYTLPIYLTALVFGCYGKHDNEAWISLHIADKRLEIADFKQSIVEEEKTLNQSELCAREEIRLLDQCDSNSRLEFNLKVRSQQQAWANINDSTKQVRRLKELIKLSCSSHISGPPRRNDMESHHTCHHKLKWVFKPTDDTVTASFSCTIHVKHVLCQTNVTDRYDDCQEGLTDILVPPINMAQPSSLSRIKQASRTSTEMAFAELPSSRKPMFSRRPTDT